MSKDLNKGRKSDIFCWGVHWNIYSTTNKKKNMMPYDSPMEDLRMLKME
jgi:hypothetical protein